MQEPTNPDSTNAKNELSFSVVPPVAVEEVATAEIDPIQQCNGPQEVPIKLDLATMAGTRKMTTGVNNTNERAAVATKITDVAPPQIEDGSVTAQQKKEETNDSGSPEQKTEKNKPKKPMSKAEAKRRAKAKAKLRKEREKAKKQREKEMRKKQQPKAKESSQQDRIDQEAVGKQTKPVSKKEKRKQQKPEKTTRFKLFGRNKTGQKPESLGKETQPDEVTTEVQDALEENIVTPVMGANPTAETETTPVMGANPTAEAETTPLMEEVPPAEAETPPVMEATPPTVADNTSESNTNAEKAHVEQETVAAQQLPESPPPLPVERPESFFAFTVNQQEPESPPEDESTLAFEPVQLPTTSPESNADAELAFEPEPVPAPPAEPTPAVELAFEPEPVPAPPAEPTPAVELAFEPEATTTVEPDPLAIDEISVIEPAADSKLSAEPASDIVEPVMKKNSAINRAEPSQANTPLSSGKRKAPEKTDSLDWKPSRTASRQVEREEPVFSPKPSQRISRTQSGMGRRYTTEEALRDRETEIRMRIEEKRQRLLHLFASMDED